MYDEPVRYSAYLPQDRLRAAAAGTPLPDRADGSVLFADISGFTALTESLRRALGVRRGAEELATRLGNAYSALIAAVERYGGSVVCFAGDSVTCWFPEPGASEPAGSARCATKSALAMQTAIAAFPTLGLKVTVVWGTARRFLVGDPDIQLFDVIAGNVVTAACRAQRAAERGDVLVDERAAVRFGDPRNIREWRAEQHSGRTFGVIRQRSVDAPESETDCQATDGRPVAHDDSLLRCFVHEGIRERHAAGQGAFSVDFRPCVAAFVAFCGVDLESDSAEKDLDALVRTMQRIAARHGGTVMDVTTGDEGTYAYINFGALRAYEDDVPRAVTAACELRAGSSTHLRIGIAHGTMRVGAYGGVTRRTFGALGDSVNLAARLMATAAEGEILVTGTVHAALRGEFVADPRPPVSMRGRSHPVAVFSVSRAVTQRFVRLGEPVFALPMVGRDAEVALIGGKLDAALKGTAQVLGIAGEAGMGKTRLVAEAIRSARAKGYAGYRGVCRAEGANTPYFPWQPVWSAFFDVDPSAPLRRQIRSLRNELQDLAPLRVDALPLLASLLHMEMPESDFTRTLGPKARRSVLHAAFRECLEAAAREEPLLIVIEDAHWSDELSHELLAELATALTEYPVCFILAFRPLEVPQQQISRLAALPHYTRIELAELTQPQVEHVIRAKLAQLYPERGTVVPPQLTGRLAQRSQGNPFYLEELLDYLHDRGIDPLDPAAADHMELPDSLHRLILTRIDRLTRTQRTILRAASVIGQSFSVRWLTGYCPELGDVAEVLDALDVLQEAGLTISEATEPGQGYQFRHVIIHEVAYESLPFAARAGLHGRLARFLEAEHSGAQPVAALAFHYGRSANTEKQRIYLRKAGEIAQRTYANDAAVIHYGELLSILTDARDRMEIHARRAEVLQLAGSWFDAEADYLAALALAEQLDDDEARKAAQFAMGRLCVLRGDLDRAASWFAQAEASCKISGDDRSLARVMIETGLIRLLKGEFARAAEPLREGMALAHDSGDTSGVALALNHLGSTAVRQSDFAAARALYEESLVIRRNLNDFEGISATLSNLAFVAIAQGDYSPARILLEESLDIDRRMGDRWGLTVATNVMGQLAHGERDYSSARRHYEESLALAREMDDRSSMCIALINLGHLELAEGNHTSARSRYSESLEHSRPMEHHAMVAYGLLGMGLVELALGHPHAGDYVRESLRLRRESGQRLQVVSSLVGIAALLLRDGDASRAAQLLGAVESALAAMGAVLEPAVQDLFPSLVAAARDALGDADLRSSWIMGTARTLDEAVLLSEGDAPASGSSPVPPPAASSASLPLP